MDTTVLETTWKRACYQEIKTRTALPHVATHPIPIPYPCGAIVRIQRGGG